MLSSPIATYPITDEEISAISFLQKHGYKYSQFRDYDQIVTINRYPHPAATESDGFKSFAEYGHEIDEYERIKTEQEKFFEILSITKMSTGNDDRIKEQLDVLIRHLKIRMDASSKAQASSIKSIEDKLKRANPKIKQKQIDLVLRDNSKTMQARHEKAFYDAHEGHASKGIVSRGALYLGAASAAPRIPATAKEIQMKLFTDEDIKGMKLTDKDIETMRLTYSPHIPAKAFSTDEVFYPFNNRDEGIAVLDEHDRAIDQNRQWLDELNNKFVTAWGDGERYNDPLTKVYRILIYKLKQQDSLRREAQKRSLFTLKAEFSEDLKPQSKPKKTLRWADEQGHPLTHERAIPSRHQEAARKIHSAYKKHLAQNQQRPRLRAEADVVDGTDSRTGVRGQSVPTITIAPPPPAPVRRTSPRTAEKHGGPIDRKELKARNKERSVQTPGIFTENPALRALRHRPERQAHDVVDSTDWQTGVSGRGIPAIAPMPPSVRRPAPSKIGRFDDKDGLRDRTTRHSIDRVDKNNGMRFLKPLEENALLTQPLSPSVRKPEYSRTTPRPMPAPVIRNKPRQPSSMKHMKNDERDGKIYQMSRNPLFYHTPSIVTDNPLAAALKRRQERTPVDVVDEAPSIKIRRPSPPPVRKSTIGAASGTSENVFDPMDAKTGIHGRGAHTPSPVRSRRMDADRAAIARKNALVKALAHQPATARAQPSGDISPASSSNRRTADENPALRMIHNPMRRDMPLADANPEIPTESLVSAIALRFGGSKKESAPARPEQHGKPRQPQTIERLKEEQIAGMSHFRSSAALTSRHSTQGRSGSGKTRVRAPHS